MFYSTQVINRLLKEMIGKKGVNLYHSSANREEL